MTTTNPTPPASANRDATREGELITTLPVKADASLMFIGTIATPFKTRADCPRQGRLDGPECQLIIQAPFEAALKGLEAYDTIEVIYWMHEARRDLLQQCPKNDGHALGTFALRSPLRPNPLATSLVALIRIEGTTVTVRGLDCIDGTPLLDVKPNRCAYSPPALPKPMA